MVVVVGGSGSTFIYGLCDREYRPNMTRQECLDFVTMCVSHAMARDGSSGGVIRLSTKPTNLTISTLFSFYICRTVVVDENGFERNCLSGDEIPFTS